MSKEKRSLKRAQILKTATQIFASQGFSQASMDDIAAQTPVSKATLYKYFKDKNDLFIQVVTARCEAVREALGQSMNLAKDPLKALVHVAMNYWELIHSPEALSLNSMLIAQKRQFPQQAQLYYASGPQCMLRLLADFLKEIAPRLHLKIDDFDLAAVTFVNLVRGDTYYRALLGLEVNRSSKKRDAVIEHALQIFIKGYQA
ncbi:MAG: TetR/AcrR family transcriptional regulator [Holosporales bacterium]